MEASTGHKEGRGVHGHEKGDDDGGCDNVCTKDVFCASMVCGTRQWPAGWGNEVNTVCGMRRAGM